MAKQLVQILEEAQQAVPPELRQFSMTSGGPASEPDNTAAWLLATVVRISWLGLHHRLVLS